MVPLVSGEVQFWRLDPSDWDRVLRAVAAEGVPIVSTYLSWRRHVPEPMAPFNSGGNLDVRRFLALCAKHGLLVALKPGPWICAEEPNGGYPDWLLADEALLALDARGEPIAGYNPPFLHPVPCYLHPRYLEHARRWIELVLAEIRGYLHPRGPVALIQLDNEPSHCFRDGMYEADYHPVCLEAFAGWVGDPSVEPPREPEVGIEPGSERRRLEHEWIRFRESLLAEHLRLLRDAYVELGADEVAFTVNYNRHRIDGVPQSAHTIRSTTGALGGMDHYYEPPLDSVDLLGLAWSTALSRADGEPILWSPEIQAGIWRAPGEDVAYPDPSAAEQELYYLAALAFGLNGLNFYMLVNRENWALAPIEANGETTPTITAVRNTLRLVSRLCELGELEPVSPVALAWQPSYARDAYAAAATDATRARPHAATTSAFSTLAHAGYLPRIWNAEQRPSGDAAALVTTTASYMPRDAQNRLVMAAERGVHVVVVGRPPTLDEEGDPCDTLARAIEVGRVAQVGGVDDLAKALDASGIEAPVRVAPPSAFAILHRASKRRVVFVLNPGAKRRALSLSFADRAITALRPLSSDCPEIPVVDRNARIVLPPRAGVAFEAVA